MYVTVHLVSDYFFFFSKSLRRICSQLAENKWFDYTILVFIASNCITLAMERPTIPPESYERVFLASANYIFTVVFTFEMAVKVSLNLLSILFQTSTSVYPIFKLPQMYILFSKKYLYRFRYWNEHFSERKFLIYFWMPWREKLHSWL